MPRSSCRSCGLTAALRTQLLDAVTDEDLAFALPRQRGPSATCAWTTGIPSARTSSRSGPACSRGTTENEEPGLSRSVERLRGWYAAMDAEFEAVVGAIPEDTFQTGTIDRGDGFQMPMGAQFHTWREAILIFCAKADVYLRALGARPTRSTGSTGSAEVRSPAPRTERRAPCRIGR